jgi:hypothetical protein
MNSFPELIHREDTSKEIMVKLKNGSQKCSKLTHKEKKQQAEEKQRRGRETQEMAASKQEKEGEKCLKRYQ